MREPHRGVARLDGTNMAQAAWWDKHSESVTTENAAQMQKEMADGKGPELHTILDSHLEQLDALRVAMPAADELRIPHIKSLVPTMKPNAVHEATVSSPPLKAVSAEEPGFVRESLVQRKRRRRGRFLSSKGREEADLTAAGGEQLAVQPASTGARRVGREGESQDAISQPRGRKHTKPKAAPAEGEAEPMQPVRNTALGPLWASLGASWIEHNHTALPSDFPEPDVHVAGTEASEPGHVRRVGATLSAYQHTRQAASLFDVSHKVGVRVVGADREFVADHFLTCSLSKMRTGDVQYACVLDTKGLVLDDALVYVANDAIEILTSGCHSRQLVDYIGQFVVHVRRSGADVALQRSQKVVTLALQGPKACEALCRALGSQPGGEGALRLKRAADDTFISTSVLPKMPYMSFVELVGGEWADASAGILLRAGSTGEDGFEIVAQPGANIEWLAESLLSQAPLVRPAGLYCMDMLRMEAGMLRVGADILSGRVTPIRASLAWTLDQGKMRSHLMFGWYKLFKQLAAGPRFRIVGLLVDGRAHAGCMLMCNPGRQFVGTITSTAWSPALKSRVAIASVKPEYAKSGTHLLVTVPFNLPRHRMRGKDAKKWLRQGPMRSGYRQLVPACVMALPFVQHRYEEPRQQRNAGKPFGARKRAEFREAQGHGPQAPPTLPKDADLEFGLQRGPTRMGRGRHPGDGSPEHGQSDLSAV